MGVGRGDRRPIVAVAPSYPALLTLGATTTPLVDLVDFEVTKMGYYMRYFTSDARPVSLSEMEAGLRLFDPAYGITTEGDSAELRYGDGLYGVIEINRPGDGLFEDEIAEEIEQIRDNDSPNRERVIQALRNANATIAIQVIYQDRDAESTFATMNLLWKWLFANRQGLLQADGDGYYDEFGLILGTGWS